MLKSNYIEIIPVGIFILLLSIFSFSLSLSIDLMFYIVFQYLIFKNTVYIISGILFILLFLILKDDICIEKPIEAIELFLYGLKLIFIVIGGITFGDWLYAFIF